MSFRWIDAADGLNPSYIVPRMELDAGVYRYYALSETREVVSLARRVSPSSSVGGQFLEPGTT